MKKIKIFRASLLAPILLGVIFLVIYLITGKIGLVDTTAFVNFPDGNLIFNHKLPFAISRLWDIPISYLYLLLILIMIKDEKKEWLFVISIVMLLVSIFFAFGFHFILGLAFSVFAFFFGGTMSGSIKGGVIVSAVICLATVFFLGLVTGFGPGLAVGMIVASILILSISAIIALAYIIWRALSKSLNYLYRWMFVVE